MLKRKYTEQLNSWKEHKNEKALVINGARQVGKTYLVEKFGETYESFIELNFIEKPNLIDIFSGELTPEAILTGINLNLPGTKIIDGKTLIFLDEIQECPNAITALKFLAKDKRIDVIATGSALGMAYNRATSFPVGYVEYMDMTALDFREFLWALGIDNTTIQQVKSYYEKMEVVPEGIDKAMRKYLAKYMVIGGMPEVVNTFLEKEDYYGADQVQKRIYRDYLADIARFANPDIKIKAEACFKSIPGQLNKDNHKFQYGVVEKKGSARKFESSVDWILNANMAVSVHNISHVEYPLADHKMADSFRIYMSDIGLYVGTYDYSLKAQLLNDVMDEKTDSIILKAAKGGLYEALVCDILYKNGHRDLFFYRNEAGTAELEYLYDGPEGVVPIEVKAGKSRTKTLNNILKKEDIKRGYKLSAQNVGQSEKKVTMPIYMAMFM